MKLAVLDKDVKSLSFETVLFFYRKMWTVRKSQILSFSTNKKTIFLLWRPSNPLHPLLRDFAWFGVPESNKFFKGKSFPLQTNPHKKQNETPQGNEIEENDEPRDRNALGRDFVKMAQE